MSMQVRKSTPFASFETSWNAFPTLKETYKGRAGIGLRLPRRYWLHFSVAVFRTAAK
jgi:hypothetical protein